MGGAHSRYFCRTAVHTVGYCSGTAVDASFALHNRVWQYRMVWTFGALTFGIRRVVIVCALRRNYMLAALWHVSLSGRGIHRRTLRHRERPVLASGHAH